MDQRTESRVREWEDRPFPGGYAALQELADADFSGAVVAPAGPWLFMLNGRVIGVFEGTIEAFADAEGTVHEAPHPSLPLLFAMVERGGDRQAQYYTNDTPISEAHDQLSDASFSGYIELSENVLSGDYYVLYYGGRSLSCAFVGSSERLVTGDEAFRQADDEVGIYEVRTVDIEVVEIPEPTAGTGGGAADAPSGGGGATGGSAAGAESRDATDAERQDAAGAGGPTDDGAAAGGDPGGDPPATGEDAVEAADIVAEPTEVEPDEGASADPDPDPDRGVAAEPTREEPTGRDPDRADDPAAGGRPDEPAGETPGRADDATGGRTDDATAGGSADRPPEPADDPDGAGARTDDPAGADPAGAEPAGGTGEAPRSESAREPATTRREGDDVAGAPGESAPGTAFEEVTRIPSLSPGRTDAVAAADGPAGGDARATGDGGATDAARSGTAGGGDPTGGRTGDAGGAGSSRSDTERATGGAVRDSGGGDAGADPAAAAAEAPDDGSRSRLAAKEERIQELEAELADLRVQRDGLRDERDELRERAAELETRIEELEAELEQTRQQYGGGEDDRRLDPETALQSTNLFVRYGSKGGGTLEDAHAGEVDREEVNANLRLESHTQFDADGAVVEGQPFTAFLEDSIHRRFVEWVVRDLLYEIQDTGSVSELQELYDALPNVDRAELFGEVSVQYTEDGEEFRERRTFDVVLRDRMGNPLMVANLNDSREPATDDMMSTVVENAGDVKASNDSLAAGLLVTASFFEPAALEMADEETGGGGGLMGGGSKASYVRLSRKRGYHLLLVETRGGEFHVNVPEL